MRIRAAVPAIAVLLLAAVGAQAEPNGFRQLDDLLPPPNEYRNAAGAPGRAYWQQRVDYDIKVDLDDDRQWITGTQTVTYRNNSPDTLTFLWVQLDQNRYAKHSHDLLTRNAGSDRGPHDGRMSFEELDNVLTAETHGGGHQITAVQNGNGRDLKHGILDTMMWIDLAEPLRPGKQAQIRIAWNYHVVDGRAFAARGGYERSSKTGAYIYSITEWFPRLAAYTEVGGWQHKGYLGRGEFALEFGSYKVAITVPARHIVSATGVLTNPQDVLSATQRDRLAKARTAERPVRIVTAEEAKANLEARAAGKKTWRFEANDVRDFAFGSSPSFMWDAWGYRQGQSGRVVMAQALYPEEGVGLWDRYAVHAIVQALETYSKHTFDYPYPVAIAVKGPYADGMEYPMISFNGPVPTQHADGQRTYSRVEKSTFINLLIHETGHFYFPMLVNTNERRWAWMDEGIVSFLQVLAMEEWEAEAVDESRKDQRALAVRMAREADQIPIMSDPDSMTNPQSDLAGYNKSKLALLVLREAVMGPERFDRAFKEYARRWIYKRAEPADFFRTMEDASGMDLDWFWRGWFFSTGHVDIAIDGVRRYSVNTMDPQVEAEWARAHAKPAPQRQRRVDRFPELKDFYNAHDEATVTDMQRTEHAEVLKELSERERALLKRTDLLYVIEFSNEGGLAMPLLLDIEYADGSHEEMQIPAEIWRYGGRTVSKLLIRDKTMKSVTLDPRGVTADANVANNRYSVGPEEERLELYDAEAEAKKAAGRDLMRDSGETLLH